MHSNNIACCHLLLQSFLSILFDYRAMQLLCSKADTSQNLEDLLLDKLKPIMEARDDLAKIKVANNVAYP